MIAVAATLVLVFEKANVQSALIIVYRRALLILVSMLLKPEHLLHRQSCMLGLLKDDVVGCHAEGTALGLTQGKGIAQFGEYGFCLGLAFAGGYGDL
ncbi:hypothetical protein [Ktedonobacter robiniae]|uniref:hypothetical protein n=1 Tax=Ktedonobacter robiniae TaxID=2778365 RepID=UPI0019156776|nr:hypothetical protein [Ktedonobacter robiniae]